MHIFVFICLVGRTESSCFVRSHNRSVNFQYDLKYPSKIAFVLPGLSFISKGIFLLTFKGYSIKRDAPFLGLNEGQLTFYELILQWNFSMKLWDLPTRNHYKVHKHHHTFYIQFSNFVEEHVVEHFCKFVLELARICQNILVQIQ